MAPFPSKPVSSVLYLIHCVFESFFIANSPLLAPPPKKKSTDPKSSFVFS